MTEFTSTIAAALSTATTGSETPNVMQVSRPSKESVWALFGALGVLCAVGFAIIGILAFAPWPTDTALAGKRIFYLGMIGWSAMGCIGIVIVALASSRLGRIDASVGQDHLAIDGRRDTN